MALKDIVTIAIYLIIAATFLLVLFSPTAKTEGDSDRDGHDKQKLKVTVVVIALVALVVSSFGTTLM